MKKIFSILLLTVAFVSCKKEGQNTVESDKKDTLSTAKIVSLNGAITETLAQLGEENNIIGVDVTSNYPEGLKAQNLGHVRSITAESILALQPTVIYASSKDMNPDLLEKLKASKVKLELIDQEFSAQGTANLITTVAKSLNKENYQPIIDNINAKLATVKTLEKKPKVLFIYARGAGNLMVAGKDTPLEKIITIAGGENAANDFSDFKPLTPEALVASNPDVILMFDSGLASIGGVDGLLKIEGIGATNAGKNKKVIAIEGQYLSGFGPRLGDAAVDLNKLLQ